MIVKLVGLQSPFLVLIVYWTIRSQKTVSRGVCSAMFPSKCSYSTRKFIFSDTLYMYGNVVHSVQTHKACTLCDAESDKYVSHPCDTDSGDTKSIRFHVMTWVCKSNPYRLQDIHHVCRCSCQGMVVSWHDVTAGRLALVTCVLWPNPEKQKVWLLAFEMVRMGWHRGEGKGRTLWGDPPFSPLLSEKVKTDKLEALFCWLSPQAFFGQRRPASEVVPWSQSGAQAFCSDLGFLWRENPQYPKWVVG